MATSTAVFTPESGVGKLQVETKFKSLIKAATGKDSAYMHAKDSLTAYFSETGEGKDLSGREKAEMYAKLVTDTSLQVTTHMMDLALKIEIENRDAPYMLAKMVADVKQTNESTDKVATDKLYGDKQILTANVNIDKVNTDILATKAGVLSKTGYNPWTTTFTTANPSISNTLATDYVGSLSAMASRHAAVAASHRKDGLDTYTINTDGSYVVTNTNPYVCLTESQKNVSIRQEEAFYDNKVQHAVNSSANFMSLLLSSQNDAYLDYTYVDDGTAMSKWFGGMNTLLNDT